MDRKSAIGFFLIVGLVFVWSYMMKPKTEEQLQPTTEQTEDQDTSTPAIANQEISEKEVTLTDPDSNISGLSSDSSSVAQENIRKYGLFAPFIEGEDQDYTIENDLMKVRVSRKGGRITYVELKNFKTFDSLPLVLTKKETSNFNYVFPVRTAEDVNSSQLYFDLVSDTGIVTGDDSLVIRMRVQPSKGKYIEHVYTMYGNDYLIDFDVNIVGMEDVLPKSKTLFNIDWNVITNRTEREQNKRTAKITRNVTTIYYKTVSEHPAFIKDSKDTRLDQIYEVKWIAFKQHFFTQTLIAKDNFEEASVELKEVENSYNKKDLKAELTFPLTKSNDMQYQMSFYYGPNHFKTLKSHGFELERQIFLGRGILRWVNTVLVIPLFNFLKDYISNFGIIILILTLVIKLLLLPLTFKSYQSTAKMKVLKPELDALKEKIGKDAAKMQQEQMKLYRQAGVSPLGGCLPMLLQMPILIALFRFFPSSIELRQQAFLWAHDLSTYDSIWTFPNGFEIPGYGGHVSLFTLLMTISTLMYTRMNSQMMSTGSGEFGKQMKVMQYIMPIMFLGFFNNYAAGLSYYYFLANIITFGQQYLFKFFIDEDKLRQKIDANKKKRAKKPKSRWQKRLEDLQKAQQQQASSRNKR